MDLDIDSEKRISQKSRAMILEQFGELNEEQ